MRWEPAWCACPVSVPPVSRSVSAVMKSHASWGCMATTVVSLYGVARALATKVLYGREDFGVLSCLYANELNCKSAGACSYSSSSCTRSTLGPSSIQGARQNKRLVTEGAVKIRVCLLYRVHAFYLLNLDNQSATPTLPQSLAPC